MKTILNQLQGMETKLLQWADLYSFGILRGSIGIIFILFGILKFFPNHSPAEQLAADTIEVLSLGLFSGSPALITLAVFETALGLCLLFNFRLRLILYLALAHMAGTFLPLFFFPEQAFAEHPLSLSLLGQYIIKNFVLIGAFLVLYAKTAKRKSKIILMPASISSGENKVMNLLPLEGQEKKHKFPLSR